MSALQDDFADGVRGAPWVAGSTLWQAGAAATGVTVVEAAGVLTITPSTSSPLANGYVSATTYDLTGSAAFVQVPQAATGSGGSVDHNLLVGPDPANTVYWQVEGGRLYAFKVDGGTRSNVVNLGYDASAHAWWRIRESAGTIFFDTSTDGTSWTNRGSTTVGWAMTAVLAELSVASWGTNGTVSAGTFDNVNTTGVLAAPARRRFGRQPVYASDAVAYELVGAGAGGGG